MSLAAARNPLLARVSPSSDPWGGLREPVRAPGSGPLDVRTPAAKVRRRSEDGRFASRGDVAASERHPAGARFTIPVARSLDQPARPQHKLKPGHVAMAAHWPEGGGSRPGVGPESERVFSIEEANARFQEHPVTMEVCVGFNPGAPVVVRNGVADESGKWNGVYQPNGGCMLAATAGGFLRAGALNVPRDDTSDKSRLSNFAGRVTAKIQGASGLVHMSAIESEYAWYGALRGMPFDKAQAPVGGAANDHPADYCSDGAEDDVAVDAELFAYERMPAYRELLRSVGMDVYVDGVVVNLDEDDDGDPPDWSMDPTKTRAVANVAVQGHSNMVAPEGSGLNRTRALQDVLVTLVWQVDSAEKYVPNELAGKKFATLVPHRNGEVAVHRAKGTFRLVLLSGDRAKAAHKNDELLVHQTLACWRVARVTDTAAYRPTNKRPFADAEHLLHVNVAVSDLPTGHYAKRSWMATRSKIAPGPRSGYPPRRSFVSPLELYADDWEAQEFRP